jgi:sugar fermentation stimulation protein A
MKLSPGLVDGTFITRLNRFAALVDVEGEEVMVHVANSGRMREMFVPGYKVKLKPVMGDHRKTKFDLVLVRMEKSWASADARLPNSLVAEALERQSLPPFRAYSKLRREVTFGESRLDLMLEGELGLCYIETKSVTLVVDRVGLFPDAPTTRGAKHMRSLQQAVREGHKAAVVFVIQRSDVEAFATHDAADPDFGQVFRQALSSGVEAFAYKCEVTEASIQLSSPLPIQA